MITQFYTRSYFFIGLLSFLIPMHSFGQLQDVIYTVEGGEIKGEIEGVNNGQVFLTNKQPVHLSNMLLAIKTNGDILTHSDTNNKYQWLINEDHERDKIITRKHEVFAAEKIDLINEKIAFHDFFNGRYFMLDKSEVALILRSSGHHYVANPETAKESLSKVNKLSNYASKEPRSTIELSPEEQDYFSRRALKKTEALSLYLSIISDTQADELDQDQAVQQAINLFIDDERLVEVTSLNTDLVRSYKIGEYLHHIRMLPYDRVEILWNQVAYVNQIKRSADGNYYGLITVEQIFRGFNEENAVIYEDLTQKNLQVIIKPYLQVIDGKELKKWDVFLSDIGVQNTSTL